MTSPGGRGLWRAPLRAGIVVAVVVGVVLRFVTTSPLWLDEALSVEIARLPLADIPEALRQDGHPPLYYFLLHGWMELFGDGDIAVRALSGVLAVAGLPLAWMVGRRSGGLAVAWAVLVLLALSPYGIRYATETRMYSLITLLVLAGWLLVVRAVEHPRPGRLVAVAGVSGLLLLSHYWALWLVASTAALLARRGPTRKVAGAVAAGGVLLLPWLPSLLDQAAHTGTPWAGPARPTTIVVTTLQDFGGGEYAEAVLLGWVVLVLGFLGLFGRTRGARVVELDLATVPGVRRELAVVALAVGLASVAGYVAGTTYATRYAAVVFPLVLLAAATGLTRLPDGAPLALVGAGVVVLGFVGGVHNAVTARTQAGDIADVVRRSGARDDLVVSCPDQLGPALQRALPAEQRVVVYPTFATAERVDWRDYEARNRSADPVAFAERAVAEADGASLWLVASGSYRTFEGQCEALQAALATKLPGAEVLVAEDPDEYFEHASLFRYPLGRG